MGLGGTEILPPEEQGLMYDFGSSPNDPLFILHHLMVDCILGEWKRRHPDTPYPTSPSIRDGHRKDDYLRTLLPLVTNNEAFADPENFGYYCPLSNLDSNSAVGMYVGVERILLSSCVYSAIQLHHLVLLNYHFSSLEVSLKCVQKL